MTASRHKDALDRVDRWLIRRTLANRGERAATTARRRGVTREGLYK